MISLVGSGQQVREERQTFDFETLNVNDGIAVTVVVDPGQPRRVQLVGDDNLVALVRTQVETALGGARPHRLVWTLARTDHPDAGTAELIVAKQRNGPTGVVRLAFLREQTRFANLAQGA